MIIETGADRLTLAPGRRPRALAAAILTILCWANLLMLVAVWLFMRQEAERWWPATLLLVSPRWPLALPTMVLWAGALARRTWAPALPQIAATAVLAGPLLGMRASWPAGLEARGDLRVLTCNVHRNQTDASQLREAIASAEPDVVVLQDWSSSIERDGPLFDRAGWDVRREGQLLIASRLPIARVTPVTFDAALDGPADERAAAVCCDLQTRVGVVRLINVHLSSPHLGLIACLDDHGQALAGNADRRWQESAALVHFVEAATGPVLLAGDFNTTDDSPIFREDWPDFRDAFTERGLGIGYTYVNRHTQLRIDHVLAGPGWQVVRCWVGPDVGSPHRPLIADLRFR